MYKNKLCKECGTLKSSDNFYPYLHKNGKTYLHSICKQCSKLRSMQWRKKNPERNKELINKFKRNNPDKIKFYNVKAVYGIDKETYFEWLNVQNNKCGICSVDLIKTNRALDHCHISLSIRGFLCNKCNSNLGWYERRKGDINKWLAKLPLGVARR